MFFTPFDTTSGRITGLLKAADTAARAIPPAFPLSATVAVNPFLGQTGEDLATTAARKIVFVNGHGGNSALMAMMNRELRLKFGLQTFLAHPHMPADQGGSSAASELGMGIHGGMDETSVMLHLRPDLVDMSRAVRRVPEAS